MEGIAREFCDVSAEDEEPGDQELKSYARGHIWNDWKLRSRVGSTVLREIRQVRGQVDFLDVGRVVSWARGQLRASAPPPTRIGAPAPPPSIFGASSQRPIGLSSGGSLMHIHPYSTHHNPSWTASYGQATAIRQSLTIRAAILSVDIDCIYGVQEP
ncbi:hypothetical protein BD769DRAFT_1683586 [Suillus cothurnatus]|nr:hypothetical protein BD769DRAFT_1683586 [Suillus cothurnatus]